jgi:pimeloyl-ACP methyl ester carboxylesterase
VPAAHAYIAAELIPDCQLHIFKGCGHSVYKQRAGEFSQLVASFLD